jgi:predicted metal-dependent HD superfamily phosphohydrolase
MNANEILNDIRENVVNYMNAHRNEQLRYHQLDHTTYVAAHAAMMAAHYQLNEEDAFAVTAAAWFHDVGYFQKPAGHEEISAEFAVEFLASKQVQQSVINQIKGCILATTMPQAPKNLLEEIICDADLFHLGTIDFRKKNKLLMEEYNLLNSGGVDKIEWLQRSISFLESHHFHTQYCILLLNEQKAKNLDTLKKKLQDKLSALNPSALPIAVDGTGLAENKGKKNADKPDKGIETMFRISSGNHQRLSDMADNKAHILITVNSIILSAIISLVLRKTLDHPYLLLPSYSLLIVSLVAMIFSILSTRPSISKGVFSKADIDQKSVNLLFFGNFYRMDVEDYAYGMFKMMEDRDFLYGSLIKDVYAQGAVLGKKYRLLRIAYNIFMFGLIFSVLAFVICSALAGKDDGILTSL